MSTMQAGEIPVPGEGTPHPSHGVSKTGSYTSLASASALATDTLASASDAQGAFGFGSGFGSTPTGLASALAPDTDSDISEQLAQASHTATEALSQTEGKIGYWPKLKLTGPGSSSRLALAPATQLETQASAEEQRSSSSSSRGSSKSHTQETHKESTAPSTQETHSQNQQPAVGLPLGGAQTATQQGNETQGLTHAAHPRQHTPKRDRNERSTSVTPVTKEETEPARRSSLFEAGAHQRAEEIPQRNWFQMTEDKNAEGNEIATADVREDIAELSKENKRGTVKDTETTVDGMTEELITAIATHLGGIIAETTPPEQLTTLPEAQGIPDLLKTLGGLSDTHKQQFAGICGRYPEWHRRVTNTMTAEINRKNGLYKQLGKRVKFTQATENGRPNKGLSPARSEAQVTQDKTDAEAIGDITFTSIRDLVSFADTSGEQVAFEFLEVASILDEQSRHKIRDPNYAGPSSLSFTMHNYYEQLLGVRAYLQEHGVLLQPPSSLLAAPAQHPLVAEAEKWWTTTWNQVQTLQDKGGHIFENKKIEKAFIKTSTQKEHRKTQETQQHTQAQAIDKDKQGVQRATDPYAAIRRHQQAQETPVEDTKNTPSKRELEGDQYAPVGKADTALQHTPRGNDTEEALGDPNELDEKLKLALDRETRKKQKTDNTEVQWEEDKVRLLVMATEQIHRLQTEGVTCKQCGNHTTCKPENIDTAQGIHILCTTCSTPQAPYSLFRCHTLESAGVPEDAITQAKKLAEIKKAVTTGMEQHLETNTQQGRRACTTRERQLVQAAIKRLEEEGLANPGTNTGQAEVRAALMGTAHEDTTRHMLGTLDKLCLYMQEDLPAMEDRLEKIRDRAEKAAQAKQETDQAQALKQLQQQLRQKADTQATEQMDTLRKSINREQKGHEQLLLEAQNRITQLQEGLTSVTKTTQTRHEQLTDYTGIFLPHKPTPGAGEANLQGAMYSSYTANLIGRLKEEINRLAGEQDKHKRYEANLYTTIQAAETSGIAPGLETPEEEENREKNKSAITARRSKAEKLLQAAEAQHVQDAADRAAANEIIRTTHLANSELEKAHQKALQMGDELNNLFEEIATDRRHTKHALAQQPPIPQEKLEEILKKHQQHTQQITQISTVAQAFAEDTHTEQQRVSETIEQADPPREIPLQHTVFQEIHTKMQELQIPYRSWEHKLATHKNTAERIMLARRALLQTPWDDFMADTTRTIEATATLSKAYASIRQPKQEETQAKTKGTAKPQAAASSSSSGGPTQANTQKGDKQRETAQHGDSQLGDTQMDTQQGDTQYGDTQQGDTQQGDTHMQETNRWKKHKKHKHRSRTQVEEEGKKARRRPTPTERTLAGEKPDNRGKHKRKGDTSSESTQTDASSGGSVKSLRIAMKNIRERNEAAEDHTNKVREATEKLAKAKDVHNVQTTARAQTLRNDLGELIPRFTQALANSAEGHTHMQALHRAWGNIHEHATQENEAVHHVHTAIGDALDAVQQDMQTRNKTDQERDMLHRRQAKEIDTLDALTASLRKTQWEQQLHEHVTTWSFKGFPRNFTNEEKKTFMFCIAGACNAWAIENQKGQLQPGALTTTGTEGEFTNKFKAIHPDSTHTTNLPQLHFQSPEEAELFGEFIAHTAQAQCWVPSNNNIRVKAIKTTQAGSVAEAATYALRIMVHMLDTEEVLVQTGEYRYGPNEDYERLTPGFDQRPAEISKTGRVHKNDLLAALRDTQQPYTEDILAGAVVDTKPDEPQEHPRIIVRISEEYAPQVAKAAIEHIKRGITALEKEAYSKEKPIHPNTRRLITQQITDLADVRKAAERELDNIKLQDDDTPGPTGDYKIGDSIEQAISIVVTDFWDTIAEGGLQFQDMNYNDGKATTAVRPGDWRLIYRQQKKGADWEHRGRSRSRAAQRSQPRTETGKDSKGHKGDKGEKGASKGHKGDKDSKGGRSESETSGATRARKNPKTDPSERRTGDWICAECKDYKWAKKDKCDCGKPNSDRSRRLAQWDTSTMNWDPPSFDEKQIRPDGDKGGAPRTYQPAQSSSSSGGRTQDRPHSRPAQQQRGGPENWGNPGDIGGTHTPIYGKNAGLDATTIRAQSKEIITRIENGEAVMDDWMGMIIDPGYEDRETQTGALDSFRRPRQSTICRYYAVGRDCHRNIACHFAHTEYPATIRAKMKDYNNQDRINRQMDRQADRLNRRSQRPADGNQDQWQHRSMTPQPAALPRRDLQLPSHTVLRDDANVRVTQVGRDMQPQPMEVTPQTHGQHHPPIPPPPTHPPAIPQAAHRPMGSDPDRQGVQQTVPAYPPPQHRPQIQERHASWTAHDRAVQQLQQQQQTQPQDNQGHQAPPNQPPQELAQQHYYQHYLRTGAVDPSRPIHQQTTWNGQPNNAWQYQTPLTDEEQRQHAEEISARQPTLWGRKS